eukprot:Blabericola_migrator_1__3397@NODE_1_length_33786_cov_123_788665_g0_i0_p15_GENE_NODE_1_length_33786_cov_123_788665_g0_i0NODE_1_length_33786_cov_123_788665_g0_i0_p15_ORF_typecomplete_len236_score43_48TBP/PF00352_21/1_5e10TBP/PF00352_21/1_1_NODE_1_length_33786_cov_123_788665_g0_i01490015607
MTSEGLFDYLAEGFESLKETPESVVDTYEVPTAPERFDEEQTDKPPPFRGKPLRPVSVTCTFKMGIKMDLSIIAVALRNVIYDRRLPAERLSIRLRSPPVTAVVQSSGNVFIAGRLSVPQSIKAAQKIVKTIKVRTPYKDAKILRFEIKGILCMAHLGFKIRCEAMAWHHKPKMVYNVDEPTQPLIWTPITGGNVSLEAWPKGLVILEGNIPFAEALHYFCEFEQMALDFEDYFG